MRDVKSGYAGSRGARRVAMWVAVVVLATPLDAARAQGVPRDRTIEASVTLQWETTRTVTPKFGFKSSKTTRRQETIKLRLFEVKGRLVLSLPDFADGTVFVDGKAVTKHAMLAGHGSPHCSSIVWEGGPKGDFCVSYQSDTDGLLLKYRYQGAFDVGVTGFYEYAVRFGLSSKGCTAALAGAQQDINEKIYHDPSLLSAHEISTARTAGGSCKLINGRKAF